MNFKNYYKKIEKLERKQKILNWDEKKAIEYSDKLKNELDLGKISKKQYDALIKKRFHGMTLSEYISNNKETLRKILRLKNKYEQKRKETNAIKVGLAAALFIFISYFIFSDYGTITGFIVGPRTELIEKEVGLYFNESASYNLILNENIDSFLISGSYSGNVKIYLNDKETLIFSSNSSSGITSITGMVISELNSNETPETIGNETSETQPVSLVIPDFFSLNGKDSFSVGILNNLDKEIRGITLSAKSNYENVSFNFEQAYYSSIESNGVLNTVLNVDAKDSANFSVDITVNVDEPDHTSEQTIMIETIKVSDELDIINETNISEEINFTENTTEELKLSENITKEVNLTENITEEANVSEDINISDNVTEEINITENISKEVNISENVTDDINITNNLTEEINVSPDVNLTKNITENITEEINESENITEDINITDNLTEEINLTKNVTEANVSDNITKELSVDVSQFEDECVDTCFLNNVSKNITLIIEVESGWVNITEIIYKEHFETPKIELKRERKIIDILREDILSKKYSKDFEIKQLENVSNKYRLKLEFNLSDKKGEIDIQNIGDISKLKDIQTGKTKDKFIKSNVIYLDKNITFSKTEIKLPKEQTVNKILECEYWLEDKFRCGNWKITDIEFTQDDDFVYLDLYEPKAIAAANIDYNDSNYTIKGAEDIYLRTYCPGCQEKAVLNPKHFCPTINRSKNRDDILVDIAFDVSDISSLDYAELCAYQYYSYGYMNESGYLSYVYYSDDEPISPLIKTGDEVPFSFSSENGWKCVDVTSYVRDAVNQRYSYAYVRLIGPDLNGKGNLYSCYKAFDSLEECGYENPSGAGDCRPFIRITK
jgi:hypothetical protein